MTEELEYDILKERHAKICMNFQYENEGIASRKKLTLHKSKRISGNDLKTQGWWSGSKTNHRPNSDWKMKKWNARKEVFWARSQVSLISSTVQKAVNGKSKINCRFD